MEDKEMKKMIEKMNYKQTWIIRLLGINLALTYLLYFIKVIND